MPHEHEQLALEEIVREKASDDLTDLGYSMEEQREMSLGEIVEMVDGFPDDPDHTAHVLQRYTEALETLSTIAVEWDVPPGKVATDVKVASIEEYNARGVEFSE